MRSKCMASICCGKYRPVLEVDSKTTSYGVRPVPLLGVFLIECNVIGKYSGQGLPYLCHYFTQSVFLLYNSVFLPYHFSVDGTEYGRLVQCLVHIISLVLPFLWNGYPYHSYWFLVSHTCTLSQTRVSLHWFEPYLWTLARPLTILKKCLHRHCQEKTKNSPSIKSACFIGLPDEIKK